MKTADETATHVCDPLLMQAVARVGTTLREKWRLDVLLGVGGMAAVYASTHRNGNRAAIKVLHPDLLLDLSMRGRFLREGYAANAVAHPGAVRVLDDDVAEDGSLFLVTELLEGETLEDRRLRLGGRLSVDDVLLLTDDLLDVLGAAHAKGIVHRDLKPDNLFLTRTGRLRVLDFGVARLRELSANRHFTKNGTVVGTARFMSPEQANGLPEDIDGRSDLWACGATMFELLSGRPIREGQSPRHVLLSAATTPVPSLSSAARDVQPSVQAIVDRALRFDKKDRWPSAEAMREAVSRAYVERHGTPVAAARRPSVPATVPDRTLESWLRPADARRSDRPVALGSREPRPPVSSSTYTTVAAMLVLGAVATLVGTSVVRRGRGDPPAAEAVPRAAAPTPRDPSGAVPSGARSPATGAVTRAAAPTSSDKGIAGPPPLRRPPPIATAVVHPAAASNAGSPPAESSNAPRGARVDPAAAARPRCLPLDDVDVDAGKTRSPVCL